MNKDDYIEIERSDGKVDIYLKFSDSNIPHLWNADKNCDHKVVSASGGGVKCTKCSGWCCF